MTVGSDQPAGLASAPRPLLAVVTLGVAAAVVAVSAWMATAAGEGRPAWSSGSITRRRRSELCSLWSIRCFDRYR